jgi:hypothetical protein
MQVLLKLLLERVRAVLYLRYQKNADKDFEKEFSPEDMELLRTCATDAEKRISSKTLRALVQAHIDTYRAYIPTVPLELALIELLGQEL